MSKYPLLWFTFICAGSEWRMEFDSPRRFKPLDGLDGYSLIGENRCVLSSHLLNLPEARAGETALHEIEHVISFISGANLVIYNCDTDGTEEKAIQILNPCRFDTLARSGFLKFPPLPKHPYARRRHAARG